MDVNNSSTCYTVRNGNLYLGRDTNFFLQANPEGSGWTNGNSVTLDDISKKINGVSVDYLPFEHDWTSIRYSLGDIPKDQTGNIIYGDLATKTSFLKNFQNDFSNNIYSVHQDVLQKRNELDNKMRDMYANNSDASIHFDNALYTNMLFTVIVTSVLYYLFVKL